MKPEVMKACRILAVFYKGSIIKGTGRKQFQYKQVEVSPFLKLSRIA